MLINIMLGGLIFGYAGWTIYRYMKKSKEGRCASCAIQQSCSKTSCQTEGDRLIELK